MNIYTDTPLTAFEAWDKVMNEGVVVTCETGFWNFPQYQKGLGGMDVVWPEEISETIPTKDEWLKEFEWETFYVTENER